MTKVLPIIILYLVCFAQGTYAESTQNIKAQYEKAEQLHTNGKQAECLLLTNQIIETLGTTHEMQRADSVTLMKAEWLCGNANIALGNGAKGLSLLEQSSGLAKTLGDMKFLAQVYNSIFYVYYNTLDFAQAQNLLAQAIELSTKTGDRKNLTRLYNNKGLTFYGQHRYAEALEQMQKALSNTLPEEHYERAQIYTNIAEVYYSQGAYAQTEQWLTKALNETRHLPINAKSIQTYLNMALVKAQNGKAGEAKEIQRSIYKVLPTLPLPLKVNALRQLADVNFSIGDSIKGLHDMLLYDQLADVNFSIGDSIKGLHDMLLYDQLADSLQKEDNNSQMRQLLIAYDTERLAQHNATLKESLHTRTFIIYGSLAFLAVVIIFSVMLWLKSREDKRKGRLIAAQKEQLLRYEQEEHERQQKKMRLELDHKSRQLTSYTIDLAAVNDFHQKVSKELEKLQTTIDKKDASETTETLKRIKSMLAHFNDKPVNDDFRIFFEEVHPEFLKKLSLAYPKLSENDLRLCAYIFLGMSTKEIAALTYHEVRSIESSRNRLRKKMNLENGADMKAFLMTEEERFNSMQ